MLFLLHSYGLYYLFIDLNCTLMLFYYILWSLLSILLYHNCTLCYSITRMVYYLFYCIMLYSMLFYYIPMVSIIYSIRIYCTSSAILLHSMVSHASILLHLLYSIIYIPITFYGLLTVRLYSMATFHYHRLQHLGVQTLALTLTPNSQL
jgi:hypothetical protein